MSKKNIILLIIGILVIVGTIFFVSQPKAASRTQPQAFIIGDTTLNLIIAATKDERTQGLSDRPALDQNTGMLFIFDEPGFHGFWMKDMNFAIDMLWLDKDFKIVHIANNATPESYPMLFQSEESASYVLEVNSGFSDLKGLKKGDILKVSQ